MKSLYEMDCEYELHEAKAAAIREDHLKLINGLIGLGYSKQEVIDFLTTYMHTSTAEAGQQYQEATATKQN